MLGIRNKIARTSVDEFVKKYRSEKYTLDIGCARSPYTKYFPNRVGFDIEKTKGVDVVGDAHKMPFKGGAFDVIVSTEVLEHLHDPHIAIAEMNRVLKTGGTLILTTRFIFPIHDAPHDYYRYTEYGMRHLFSDWEIIELRPESGMWGTFAILIQRVGFHYLKRKNILFKLFAYFYLITAYLMSFISFRNNPNKFPIISSGYYIACRKK